jgi:hypothetical protein
LDMASLRTARRSDQHYTFRFESACYLPTAPL